MSDHYYSAAPQSEHRYASCTYDYRGVTLRFTTDAGVFSRGEVDFGTNVLLNALPRDLSGAVLDMGCGWGAIGVTVGKKYPACRVVMTDVNERAAELAKQNAQANGVSAQVLTGDGIAHVAGNYDIILTNPPIRAGKQVIYGLFAAAKEKMNPGGEMYLVIRKQQGADSAVKYLKTLFSSVETIERSGGFHVIRCREEQNDAV
ncbi:MAG: class I SAM-dependent methyltransferase [Clostridia bacterium]|nr:class I SAM-dependent methyltransferase [Clostridia bacterium]